MQRIATRDDRRQFEAICSCDFVERGEAGTALSSVLIAFACGHLELPSTHPEVVRLKWQVHHKAGHLSASTDVLD